MRCGLVAECVGEEEMGGRRELVRTELPGARLVPCAGEMGTLA